VDISFRVVPSGKERGNLYLLAGDPELLLDYEAQSSLAGDPEIFPALSHLPGSVRELFVITAQKYKADYILIDLNPSTGPINKIIVMSSDYMLVPCSPDYYSYMSICSLTKILPTWHQWRINILNSNPKAMYKLPNESPRFLGYTQQIYSVYNKKPTKVYQRWMDKIDRLVQNELIPALRNCDMLLSEPDPPYPDWKQGKFIWKLASIQNYSSLGAIASIYHCPVYALTDDKLSKHNKASDRDKGIRELFEKIYEEMAQNTITMTTNNM